MNTFIFSHIMTKQKLIIYVIALILIMILSILFMQIGDPYIDHMLFKDIYQSYYEQMTLEYLNVIMPLLVVMITMHHEQKALQPLYAYFNRYKITKHKMFVYIIFFIWTGFMILIPIYVLPSFLVPYYKINDTYLLKLMMTYLQSFIMMNIVWLMINQKHVSYSILIAIAAIIYHMIIQDHFSLYLFYICPFFHQDVLQYTYHIHYQVVYIILLSYLSYYKMVKVEIS